jgi:hypothetical protein
MYFYPLDERTIPIDPFSLRLHNWQFFDSPDSGDQELYYFIIDNALPLLLYVGETKLTAKKRWQNHDCKAYIGNYLSLNRQWGLDVAVCAAFTSAPCVSEARR